jgi:hypothetical protein
MARNADGTVVIRTPGKIAQTPSGSGTGQVKPPAAKSSESGPKVVPTPGRGPVARTGGKY